ncbi:MAG TPA: ZIP family metal transporter [Candidatus Baltobacteraceae bacterium]|jgi:zinc transporter ZupT|nr:ZIP family metal transporter [Candidatus Baltobacteraceae bacterium]
MDYLALLSSIVLGACSVFWLKLDQPRHLKPLNAFVGAYLLSLTFLHLLPELYETTHAPAWVIGVLILAGFYVQVALESVSQGIEHGHSHAVGKKFPVGILAGLCIHAFIEAMALGRPDSYHDPKTRRLLLWSIVVHNYPVSIALLGMLLHSGLRRGAALGGLGLFAVMAPLGLLVSGNVEFFARHSQELMAVVIGIFMHISTTILFESEEGNHLHRRKLGAIFIGTGLGFLSLVFE